MTNPSTYSLWKFAKKHAWHLLAFIVVIPGCASAMVTLGASSIAWEIGAHILFLALSVFFGAWMRHTWLTESGALKREATMAKWHYDDVAEKSNPPTMKDGSPITDPIKWLAADREISRDFAKFLIEHGILPSEAARAHREYLRLFKTT